MPEADSAILKLTAEIDALRNALGDLRGSISLGGKEARAAGEENPAFNHLATASSRLNSIRTSLQTLERELKELRLFAERADRLAWEQKAKRAEATAKLKSRERSLEEIQNSSAWKITKPLWKLFSRSRRFTPTSLPLADDLIFALNSPNEWKTKREILLIKGWCFSRSGRELAGVRAKIGRKGRLGRYGLQPANLPREVQEHPAARRSGFTIEIQVPRGISEVRLEAIEQGGDWEPFFEHELIGEGDKAIGKSKAFEARSRIRAARENLPRLGPIKAAKAAALLEPLFRKHCAELGVAKPFFSVITPTFNTKVSWFAEAALTLLQQSFSNWEWCIVDDESTSAETKQLLEKLTNVSPRLKIKSVAKAGIGATTNAALDLAAGEFVCLLDHDDLLDPEGLELIAKKMSDGFDAVYSDEDKLDNETGGLVEPFFKPEWSPEYFRGAMYVGHLLCVRRDLATRVRFDSTFDGVQDFEFMLRVSETGARIGHVPQVLYHWRKTPGSIAESTDAKPDIGILQEKAVNAHLKRLNLPARAEQAALPHRLKIAPIVRREFPKISVIIATKDAPELLARCLGSLYELTSYPNFEVVIVDNATTNEEALRVMRQHPVRRIDFPASFNFSRANNLGSENATGEFIVFLNNDTEIVSKDWLQQLLYYCDQPDVGAAGALLIYADRTVQHAGVALGMRGTADHTMRGFPIDVDGYAGSLACAREVSAVTAACMMIRKSLFNEAGRFNEHFFTAYQDVDLCLRLRERNLRLICTPQAIVLHYESASRRSYYDMIDRMLLLDQWETVIERGDPYYNPNLNLERGDYSLRHP